MSAELRPQVEQGLMSHTSSQAASSLQTTPQITILNTPSRNDLGQHTLVDKNSQQLTASPETPITVPRRSPRKQKEISCESADSNGVSKVAEETSLYTKINIPAS